jgi:hypothetical protein
MRYKVAEQGEICWLLAALARRTYCVTGLWGPVALVVVGNRSCSSNLLKLINRWRRPVADCQ